VSSRHAQPRGQADDAAGDAGVGGLELELDRDERAYRTEQSTSEVAPSGDPLEPESGAAGADARPWMVIGLVLLAVFALALAWAVILPLFT
jgi:hypothetical protein